MAFRLNEVNFQRRKSQSYIVYQFDLRQKQNLDKKTARRFQVGGRFRSSNTVLARFGWAEKHTWMLENPTIMDLFWKTSPK